MDDYAKAAANRLYGNRLFIPGAPLGIVAEIIFDAYAPLRSELERAKADRDALLEALKSIAASRCIRWSISGKMCRERGDDYRCPSCRAAEALAKLDGK